MRPFKDNIKSKSIPKNLKRKTELRGPTLEKKILLYPAPVRIFHWVLVVSLSIIIITGLLLSPGIYPHGTLLPLKTLRFFHVSCGFIAFAAVIFRAGYAFVTGDYKDFSISLDDIKSIPSLVRYYFFIQKEPPPLRTKFNIGQKVIYLSWLIAITYLSLTGILLLESYFKEKGGPFFLLERVLLPQTNRFIRFYLTLYMVATILGHIYLAHTEDIAKLQAMFTGWVKFTLKNSSDESNNPGTKS